MNVLLWILQGLLAFVFGAGGAYKFVNAAEVAPTIPSLPMIGWRLFGVVEVLGALALLLPPLLGRGQGLTPTVAGLLVAESTVLAVLYARQSLALSVENPFVWAVAMTLLAALLAYGRYSQGLSS